MPDHKDRITALCVNFQTPVVQFRINRPLRTSRMGDVAGES